MEVSIRIQYHPMTSKPSVQIDIDGLNEVQTKNVTEQITVAVNSIVECIMKPRSQPERMATSGKLGKVVN